MKSMSNAKNVSTVLCQNAEYKVWWVVQGKLPAQVPFLCTLLQIDCDISLSEYKEIGMWNMTLITVHHDLWCPSSDILHVAHIVAADIYQSYDHSFCFRGTLA